jgi:hypothetical protein
MMIFQHFNIIATLKKGLAPPVLSEVAKAVAGKVTNALMNAAK